MSSTVISIVSLCVSGISALTSLFVYLRNKPKLLQLLPIDIKNETRFAIPEGEIIELDELGNQYPMPKGFMVRFNFLNPSPNDIAYFHYSFIIENKLVEAITAESVGWNSKKPTFIWNRGTETKSLPFPQNVIGVFKANSLTPFYAFVPFTDNVPKEITFRIRYATRVFPYVMIRNNYKTFEYTYHLNSYQEELQKELELMKQPNKLMPNMPTDLTTNQTKFVKFNTTSNRATRRKGKKK